MRLSVVFLATLLSAVLFYPCVSPAVAGQAGTVKGQATHPVFKNPEGAVAQVEVVIGRSDVGPEGPNKNGTIIKSVRLDTVLKPASAAGQKAPGEGDARELYWLKGIKVDAGGPGSEHIYGQLSLLVDPEFRTQAFQEAERCHQPVLVQLDPGYSSVYFPEGFAVPAASDETWTFHFKQATPSGLAAGDAWHRPYDVSCTLYFVRDSELVFPVQALRWNLPFARSPSDANVLADDKFVRPKWRYEVVRTSAPFCGVPTRTGVAGGSQECSADPAAPQADQSKSSPSSAKANAVPLFDSKKDGPLLTGAKTIELETTAGKIHLLLDPSLAPNHATQLFRLLTSGVYHGTPIFRYEQDFVMQVSLAEQKVEGQAPLPDKLRGLLRRMPLEVEPQENGSVVHKKWVLSMARDDDDTASGTSSFSMILGNAPHLDKKYTIFGRVVDDPVTVSTFEKIVKEWPNHPWIMKVTEISSRQGDVHSELSF